MPVDLQTIGYHLQVLLGIFVSGAFGGIVHGLMSKKTYVFRYGQKKWDIGTFGDALVGATTSIAIFAVAGSLLEARFDQMGKEVQVFLRLIAWGVLSGYTGVRLLEPMSEKFVRQIINEESDMRSKNMTSVGVEVSLAISAANGWLSNYDLGYQIGKPTFTENQLEVFLNEADNAIDKALKEDHTNEEALRIKARIYKRKAEIEVNPEKKLDYLEIAINQTNEIIKVNPQSARGIYNRACYKALTNKYTLSDILQDLAKSIQMKSELREYATTDDDFKAIKNELEFKTLTSGKPAATAVSAGAL